MPAVPPAGQKFLFILPENSFHMAVATHSRDRGGYGYPKRDPSENVGTQRVACLQDSLLCTATLKSECKRVSRGNHKPLCLCVRHHHRMEASLSKLNRNLFLDTIKAGQRPASIANNYKITEVMIIHFGQTGQLVQAQTVQPAVRYCSYCS